MVGFNPLDRGNLYQIGAILRNSQPKFSRFNPLDRGNLYLIIRVSIDYFNPSNSRFNPLDRGNLYQVISFWQRSSF